MEPNNPPQNAPTPAPTKIGRAWRLLLLAPFFGLLWPQFYSRSAPELWGFPFFYWYQFAWMLLTALITWLVYTRSR